MKFRGEGFFLKAYAEPLSRKTKVFLSVHVSGVDSTVHSKVLYQNNKISYSDGLNKQKGDLREEFGEGFWEYFREDFRYFRDDALSKSSTLLITSGMEAPFGTSGSKRRGADSLKRKMQAGSA